MKQVAACAETCQKFGRLQVPAEASPQAGQRSKRSVSLLLGLSFLAIQRISLSVKFIIVFSVKSGVIVHSVDFIILFFFLTVLFLIASRSIHLFGD